MTDTRTVLLVVCFLGLLAVAGLTMGFTLAYQGKGVPDFIIGTTSLAAGAVAGILAKTSTAPPTPEV